MTRNELDHYYGQKPIHRAYVDDWGPGTIPRCQICKMHFGAHHLVPEICLPSLGCASGTREGQGDTPIATSPQLGVVFGPSSK